MKSRLLKKPLFLALISLLLAPGATLQADPKAGAQTLEQRVQRLERILRNQSLADLVLQLQQLQQEVQQLRGEVELQNHTMDAMSKRQRALYLDVDQRLTNLSPAAPAVAVEPKPETTESAVTSDMARPAPVAKPVPSAREAEVPPPDPKAEAQAYQKAFNLLKQGRYPESITAFQSFLKNFSGGNYEDNAQYWLGEASYVNRDFDTALVEFRKVLEMYPDSSKVPGAMLKSGYIHYEKRDWTKAREMFEKVSQQAPNGAEARLAEKRLKRMEKEGH
jgi:tol-pal system protein YbgF